MNTMFLNSEKKSKTSDPQKLLPNLRDKYIDNIDKYIALSNLRIYYEWKNIKNSYKNNKFKISAPTLKEQFELPDGSYSILDIQNYFECVLKKHEEKTMNPSLRIYINKIEYRITFKTGYYLELSTLQTMKLLGSTKRKITKNENGENVPYLEITEIALIHCNVVNNSYQEKSRVLYTFLPNNSFAQL